MQICRWKNWGTPFLKSAPIPLPPNNTLIMLSLKEKERKDRGSAHLASIYMYKDKIGCIYLRLSIRKY